MCCTSVDVINNEVVVEIMVVLYLRYGEIDIYIYNGGMIPICTNRGW